MATLNFEAVLSERLKDRLLDPLNPLKDLDLPLPDDEKGYTV